jgi:hypothetical protein
MMMVMMINYTLDLRPIPNDTSPQKSPTNDPHNPSPHVHPPDPNQPHHHPPIQNKPPNHRHHPMLNLHELFHRLIPILLRQVVNEVQTEILGGAHPERGRQLGEDVAGGQQGPFGQG